VDVLADDGFFVSVAVDKRTGDGRPHRSAAEIYSQNRQSYD
jgi:hypothetical protein